MYVFHRLVLPSKTSGKPLKSVSHLINDTDLIENVNTFSLDGKLPKVFFFNPEIVLKFVNIYIKIKNCYPPETLTP